MNRDEIIKLLLKSVIAHFSSELQNGNITQEDCERSIHEQETLLREKSDIVLQNILAINC